MADKRHFVVLGLGTFGESFAVQLCQNGCRVTGVDLDRERVDRLRDQLYEAIIADVTDQESLKHLSLDHADAVLISLGEAQNMTPSLLATLHAKELGARRIIVKGLSHEHGVILKNLGVERVVFPESEIAVELANRITWPNVLDNMPIDPDYSFLEITMPDSLVGTTLFEADLRRRFNIWVVGIKDVVTGNVVMLPDPQVTLGDDQFLVVVGRKSDLNKFREFK